MFVSPSLGIGIQGYNIIIIELLQYHEYYYGTSIYNACTNTQAESETNNPTVTEASLNIASS